MAREGTRLARRKLIEDRRSVHAYRRLVRNPIPDEVVVAERDARLAVPQSLTARIMGDPLPGRSALDQQRAAGLR